MPACYHLFAVLLLIINACTDTRRNLAGARPDVPAKETEETIRGISLPRGFKHAESSDTAYTNWLLNLTLKKTNSVYLYNGKLKPNQSVQYRVLDIDIGKKDLVQCADAAMKLRSDFLFENRRYPELKFITTSGDSIDFQSWLKGIRWKEQNTKLISFKTNDRVIDTSKDYNHFMELAFSYCGSYSLSKQLKAVTDINSIQPGDVFIKGGFPGHAVTVMAVGKNAENEKVFLLSQGYMPAQDIHILNNYSDPGLSPWYSVKEIYPLFTPQWQFETGSLRRW